MYSGYDAQAAIERMERKLEYVTEQAQAKAEQLRAALNRNDPTEAILRANLAEELDSLSDTALDLQIRIEFVRSHS